MTFFYIYNKDTDQFESTKQKVQELSYIARGYYGAVRSVKLDHDDKILVRKEQKLNNGYLNVGHLIEMDILARLGNDEDILKLLAVEINQNEYNLYFNYINGTLTSWYKRKNISDRLDKFELVLQNIIRTIAQLHNNGIYHQDIKPSNMLVHADNMDINNIYIIDFGLSRISFDSLKKKKSIYYTYLYRPPELYFSKNKYCTPSSDTWAIAMCMLEYITGVLPFRGVSEDNIKNEMLSYVDRQNREWWSVRVDLQEDSGDYMFNPRLYFKDYLTADEYNKVEQQWPKLKILELMLSMNPKDRPAPMMLAKFLGLTINNIPELPWNIKSDTDMSFRLSNFIIILNKFYFIQDNNFLSYLMAIELMVRYNYNVSRSTEFHQMVFIRLALSFFNNKNIYYFELKDKLTSDFFTIRNQLDQYYIDLEHMVLAQLQFKIYNPLLLPAFVRLYNKLDRDANNCIKRLKCIDGSYYLRDIRYWFYKDI